MTGETPDDPKKSDTLQIRIPHETKKEFLEACREERVTASDRIRGWIENFLAMRQRPSETRSKGIVAMIPRPIRKRRYLAAGVAAIGVTALLALPSAANTTFRAMFDQLDADRDGKVTELEFMAKARSFLPEDVREHLINEIRKAITEPYNPEKSRLDPALHEALRRGERAVESLTAYELEKMATKPSPMSKDVLDLMRRDVRESLGKPRAKELLPPENPELLARLERGERTVDSLTREELESVIPIWNEADFPVHGVSAEPKEEEEVDPCTIGISDAEFANPWMNSNPDDMHRMYVRGDRNKDGHITFEEFEVSQVETARLWFSSMDENADGVLSNPDYEIGLARYEKFKQSRPNESFCPPKTRPRWVPLDTNKDGAVTFEEYLVAAEKLDPR